MEREWTDDDRAALECARNLLETPGLAIRLVTLLGIPIEKGFELLPEGWQGKVFGITRNALDTCLVAAMRTMDLDAIGSPAWPRLHTVVAGSLGGLGGAFGWSGLAVELPLSTAVMLHSIADIARSEGEDLRDEEARLQCLAVFAMGGRSPSDDAAESAYFLVRVALARELTVAAEYMAAQGLGKEGAPAFVRFLVKVAERFSVQVGEKAAAQAVPIVGAAGGAAVNVVFIDHFQSMARGHFIVRRLERKFGADEVRERYEKLGRTGPGE